MMPTQHPSSAAPAVPGHERLLLSQLLWAASHGRHSGGTPTSRVQLMAILEGGAFRYDPRAHSLRWVCSRDLRLPRAATAPRHGMELVCVAHPRRLSAGVARAAATLDAAMIGARVEEFCDSRQLCLTARGPLESRALEAALAIVAPSFVACVQSIDWDDGACLPDPTPM